MRIKSVFIPFPASPNALIRWSTKALIFRGVSEVKISSQFYEEKSRQPLYFLEEIPKNYQQIQTIISLKLSQKNSLCVAFKIPSGSQIYTKSPRVTFTLHWRKVGPRRSGYPLFVQSTWPPLGEANAATLDPTSPTTTIANK